MGTWKRPLPEGAVCEDQRVAFNPTLGSGKAEEAKTEVAVEVEAKPAKGKKAKKEVVDAEVVANFRTKKDHAIFAGHFPDYPILPGVVQIEMMAQATSFIVLLLHANPFKMKMDVALLGVNEARFRKPIFPEMDLKVVTRTLKIRGPMLTSECKLYHNDQLMSEATVLASLKMN